MDRTKPPQSIRTNNLRLKPKLYIRTDEPDQWWLAKVVSSYWIGYDIPFNPPAVAYGPFRRYAEALDPTIRSFAEYKIYYFDENGDWEVRGIWNVKDQCYKRVNTLNQ
jgi:hypothetical protein